MLNNLSRLFNLVGVKSSILSSTVQLDRTNMYTMDMGCQQVIFTVWCFGAFQLLKQKS